ncbi:phage tail assembly chaperone [Caballeronia sp. LP003]|uniref:XkdW family protein n=1 Tax=Caballeronia sp. LP003 TaxID=3038551 RepID=UPI0028560D05|nr:phage tail assembly chaperone [Caballeronia sp. LP003]MDR5790270.1 phage tail assembly chaperone [Caballeronia sp. LP003]
MTNEELFYLLQKFWPNTINGTHYLTGHRLDTEGKQLGEAFIQFWRLPDPQPSKGKLLDWWAQYGDEIRATVAGVHHRWERAERLLRADALVYRAEDAGDDAKAELARKYRQALRDVPQQQGFPFAFEWPVPPDDGEVQNVARRDAVLRHLDEATAQPNPIAAMSADMLPPVTLLNVNADGTTGPLLPPPEEPMREYGNLETRTPMKPPDQRKQPIVPMLGADGAEATDDDEPLPHSPGYEESIPPNDGISESSEPVFEAPPFQPSPQPPIKALGQPDVQATIALADDPVEKLRAFLAANPDVVTYLEENPPAPEPEPDPAADVGGQTS